MSQQKAQLISPIDTFTPPGINVTGAGIVTATSFVGSGGTVTGIADSSNLNVGVITATFYGNGSGLTGVAGAGYVGQTTAAQSGTTTIDLSAGNVIYFTQDTDTTVAFASTEAVQELLFIRVKDDTTDARTITWPESIIWNGGTEPTLIDSSDADDVQIFNLTTRDQGVTWYGYEAMKNDPAVPASGNLFMWGRVAASGGQLAQNDNVQRSSPIQVPGSWTSNISYDEFSTYALKADNTFWTWGYNYGDLGQNSAVSYSSPQQIPGTTWSSVSKNAGTGFAIKTDGTLWAIGGLNTNGQLGLNDRVPRSSPIQLPGTQWSQVAGGEKITFARKTDGTLWSWGYNRDGKLGLNDTIRRSSPTQVPGTSWSYIASHTGMTFAALKTDGTLWRAGYNAYGGCGTNNTVEYSSPRQIPGTWSKVKCGGSNLFAGIKTDGTLWSNGYNGYGNVGQNDRVNRSSPKQIPGTQWNEIGGGPGLASKTDGTLWAWGQANFGSLGQNDNVHRSSPVQIPGTQWNGAIDGNYTFVAIQDYS